MILTACSQKNIYKELEEKKSSDGLAVHNIERQSQEILFDELAEDNIKPVYENADYDRYTKYNSTLNTALEKFRNDDYEDIRYGIFSGYYYYSNLTTASGHNGGLSENPSDYYPYGDITGYFDKDNLEGFRMEIGWNTDENYQKGGDYIYQCEKYSIGENIEYYSFTSDSGDQGEIPAFMCIDGISQVYFSVESKEYTGTYALQKDYYDREYISVDGNLYEIDREEQAIYKVENGVAKVFTNWCNCQQRDVLTAQKSYKITWEMVEEAIPEGYMLVNYSVADIDMDGKDDILTEIYPILDQYDYTGDYSEDNPYKKKNEYYSHQLWVLKGMENNRYMQQKLMDSIVWEDTYTLCGIAAFEGGFTMEYFVGRSPFETVLRKFQYDEKKQDWYLSKQYKNNSYGFSLYQGLTIAGPEEFGKEYLSLDYEDVNFNVSVRDYINTNFANLSKEDYGKYDDYGYLIRFADKKTANQVTRILEQELDKMSAATKKLDMCHDICLLDNSEVFLNSNTLVICFEYLDDIEEEISVDRVVPICIDLNKGTRIDFNDYFTPEEFVKLCEASDIEIKNLKELYEHYDDYEYLLKAASPSITLCLSEEGLVILETRKYWPKAYTITRDKLVDTPLAPFWDDWPEYSK